MDIEDDRYDSLGNDDNFECCTSGDETPLCIEPNVTDSQCRDSYKNDLLLLALKLRHKLPSAAIGDLLKLCNFLSHAKLCLGNKLLF